MPRSASFQRAVGPPVASRPVTFTPAVPMAPPAFSFVDRFGFDPSRPQTIAIAAA
jgi:hypothetical protein